MWNTVETTRGREINKYLRSTSENERRVDSVESRNVTFQDLSNGNSKGLINKSTGREGNSEMINEVTEKENKRSGGGNGLKDIWERVSGGSTIPEMKESGVGMMRRKDGR